jgi:zinc protease
MPAIAIRVLLVIVLSLVALAPAQAFTIDEVTSPGGIKAWLVQDRTIPLIAMSFSFRGGSTLDPPGKEGATNFITGMMDEGAGDLDSAAFQKLRDDLAFKMRFNAGRDDFEGDFQTLSKNREAAFDALRKVVTSPHFDAEPMERVRKQLLLSIKDNRDDPEQIGSKSWMALALPGDPYSRDGDGTEEGIRQTTADDLRSLHRTIFNRTTLRVAVVGDISPVELAPLLDHVFGGLPLGHEPPVLPPPKLAEGPILKVIARDIPQSVITFGHGGILRKDPDFIPAFMMSEILGGGSFGSRLTVEIREKRGLTYGVGADLVPMKRIGLYVGSLNTRNDKAGEALELVRHEIERMANEGPTQQELDEAKTYLTGAYALRFSGNSAIANQLLGIQQEDLGIDYVTTRNSRIDAVTLDQVRAAAHRILHGDKLIVTVVGKPEGLQ